MPSIFLSPHNDDETLFGAYTLMREKPTVFIVTDAHIQANRGEKGCDAITRWEESKKACEILGVPVVRVGIPDFDLKAGNLKGWMINTFGGNYEKVYAPAPQGGNPHHEIISQVAKEVFGDKVVYYATYAPGQWFSPGTPDKDIEIIPTPEERALKERAILCYASQLALNATRPHFEAVKGKSEWLIK